MEYGYIIKISNKNLYKEIQLPIDKTIIKIGMDMECDVRLYKENFFEKFMLTFSKNNDVWSIACSKNIYIDAGDVRKLLNKELKHGDKFTIRYQESGNSVFEIEFVFDFDNKERKYNRKIDISNVQRISIGNGKENSIALNSPYIKNDQIFLDKNGDKLELKVVCTTYGVYHNGKKVNASETIENGDFISIADFSFYYKDNTLFTENSKNIVVNNLEYKDKKENENYPKFNRSTRIKSVLNEEKIELMDPPAKPEKPKDNLFVRLLPSLGMLAASGVMAFMGGMMIIFSAISGGMAIVTTVIGVVQNKKEFKQKSEERIEKYNKYIEEKSKSIEKIRQEEKETLEEIYIDQYTEKIYFNTFSPDLFDRVPEDEDFLTVRIGKGDIKAKREINYKKQEKLEIEDNLQQIPEQLSEKYKNIHEAPIVCDLKSVNAVGIVGVEKYRFSIFKNFVIDICARQYSTDVKLFFVAEKEHKDKIYWCRLLPHVYNSEIGIRNIVCDDESKNLIFEYLYKELSLREQNKREEKKNTKLIVFFYDEYGFKNHPISKFVDKAKDLDVTFIFFGNKKADIPTGCGYIIDIKDTNTANYINVSDKKETYQVEYPTVSNNEIINIVNILAPVYTEEISLEGTLTKNISLYQLLNIIVVDDIDLMTNWSTTQVFKSMSAPIGVSKTGIVSLDLHDKAHGPHGLVAGTTGSGKSEILQTYILSMATLYHPYEVAFVIIDFKGGGMVNQFNKLPHLLGAITNIDGKEINRSLKSIKAELQKRQHLFADADVNHIDKYIKKYKAGEVKIPLPHLIVIVDEFAELKAEQPDFMKELISAARIGRSLGVHLILATQKPAGQVDDQIWSNSRFKLCLKVQTQEDSNEVIKSPLASEIKEPGRAYFQVGNNEIFELFQSAYSGAPEKADESQVKEFTIYSYADSGKRAPVFVQKNKKSEDGNLTQLDALVQYIYEYSRSIGLEKLSDICLPSLTDLINFPNKAQLIEADNDITTEIGIYDDPDNQYQGTYSIPLANSNVMLIGSAQSGKTNILQNIIRSVATKYTPEEVNIYVIDFASMVLKNFEKLNHVGGVVTASEDEKLKNLFKMLHTEISRRKEILMSQGLSSFSAYKDAGNKDLPQIILMIDNLTALKELYFQDDDDSILTLCREGLSVGISIIISNAQTAGIGYKYLSNFSTRIGLFCNDTGEYSSLFEHCSERVDDIHGRCIVEVDKKLLECQAFLTFEGEKEIDRVKEIKKFISIINNDSDKQAALIPEIPQILSAKQVVEQYAGYISEKFMIMAGLDYSTVAPFVLDLNELGAIALSGREGIGKHNFIKYLVYTLSILWKEQTEVYILDNIHKKLSSLQDENNVVSYDYVEGNAIDLIKKTEEKLKDRYEQMLIGNDNIVEESKMIILIINNYQALKSISEDFDALDSYNNIIGMYRNMNVCVLVSDYENTNISYNAPEIVRNLRDERHFLFFDDLANLKIFDMPLATMREFKKPIEVGDCYYIKDSECVKIKTPKCEE